MKNKLSLVTMLAVTSICSGQQGAPAAEEAVNPMMAWFKENGIAVMQGIGNAASRGAGEIKRIMQERAERNAAERRRMEDIIAHPNRYSPQQVEAAQKQLAILVEEDNKDRQRLAAMQDNANQLVLDMAGTGLKVAEEFAQAEIKAKNEQAVAAIQAKFKKDEAVEIAAANTKAYIEAFKDPKNIKAAAGYAAAIVVAGYGLKKAIDFGKERVDKYLGTPSLAQETSLLTADEKVAQMIYGKKVLSASIKDVVLEKNLEERIAIVADSVKQAATTGNFLPNVLFYGPPGTGKTMIAQRIARSSGIEYIYFAASALEQFTLEEALIKLTELFEFAKHSDKKLMIIIDEAENLFADRTKGLPEKTAKMLTHLLTYTGTESRDYMVVLLTNLPSLLDSAVLSRMDQQIEIAAPALEQRIGILNKYITELLIENKPEVMELSLLGKAASWFSSAPVVGNPIKIEEGALSQEVVAAIAQRIDGFVGRDISKLVLSIQATVNASKDKIVTPVMIETVVAQKIAQYQAIKVGFKKS